MKNRLIDKLGKIIELLYKEGWQKQATWYENKLELIKETKKGQKFNKK